MLTYAIQHTSAYVSIRVQRMNLRIDASVRVQMMNLYADVCDSAYVSIRQHTSTEDESADRRECQCFSRYPLFLSQSSAKESRNVSQLLRAEVVLHACVSIRQHTSAYVSIRQHTSAPPGRSCVACLLPDVSHFRTRTNIAGIYTAAGIL
jgi:hypothetical protein